LPDPRFPAPVELEPQPMPADQRVWLDDNQRFAPRAQPAGQHHQHLPVPLPQLWSRHLPFQDDQLLPQEHVLGHQLTFAACQIRQRRCYLVGLRRSGSVLEARLQGRHAASQCPPHPTHYLSHKHLLLTFVGKFECQAFACSSVEFYLSSSALERGSTLGPLQACRAPQLSFSRVFLPVISFRILRVFLETWPLVSESISCVG